MFSWQLNSYSYFKQLPKYLCIYLVVETLGDLQYTSRGLDPGVIFKIYTIPILMHKMRISITYTISRNIYRVVGGLPWNSRLVNNPLVETPSIVT
jgi:hypothetical protein